MYETRHQTPLSRERFNLRLLQHFFIATLLMLSSLAAGMLGYHVFERLAWIDAFLNSAMLLGGMGPVNMPVTADGKLFAGFFALYSGMVFLIAVAFVFAPLLNRLLHRPLGGQDMKLRLLLIALPLLLAGCATNPAAVEGQIRALEQQLVKAAVAGDGATLQQLFAPQFQLITPAGAVAGKQELLTMLSSGPPPYRSGSYVTETVHPYGTAVVSTGIETVISGQGAQAGKQQQRRIMQVWQRAAGGWQLLLRQATLVASAP